MKLHSLHYFSGIVLFCFISLHLTNHLIALQGVEEHIQWMNAIRMVYRNPLIEGILLLAVCTQVYSGIRLFRQTKHTPQTRFDQVQRWSGLYLALFFCIHLSAVAAGRWVLHLDTNIYFGIAGLNTFPLNLFFVPYYTMAVVAFFAHLAAVHARKMKHTFWGLQPSDQALVILFTGAVLALVLMYALTDGFAGVPIPKEYQL